MNNFKEKVQRLGYNMNRHMANFMNGRYGPDQLYRFLLLLALILIITGSLTRILPVSIISYAVMLWAVIRLFSKNIIRRRQENDWYLRVTGGIRAWIKFTVKRLKEYKTHRYRKCPHCHSTLRLPAKRGKHTVDCPRCHQEFTVRI